MKTEARCRVFKSINPQKSVTQTAQSAVLHRACGGFIYLFVYPLLSKYANRLQRMWSVRVETSQGAKIQV